MKKQLERTDYAKLAKEFGCQFHIGKTGIIFFAKDPYGHLYKLVQIIPLDRIIKVTSEITEALANDDDFKVKLS